MLWAMVIDQNNVTKSSLGANKGVALSEIWHLLAPSSSRLHHKADKKSAQQKNPKSKFKIHIKGIKDSTFQSAFQR